MKNLVKLFLLLFLFALSNIKAQNLPEWINNPSSIYPDINYLVAIGEGDTRKAAENNALSNLSLIFKSDIKVDNTQLDKYDEFFGDKESFQHHSNVTKKVNISGGQTLYNVKFGNTFTSNTGRVYIIAYIDRMETAEIYNEKISNNSSKVQYFLDIANKSDDALSKYAAFNAAYLYAIENEKLKAQLKIISPDFGNLKTNYNFDEINVATKDAAKKVSFNVSIENDTDEKIEFLIKDLVNNKGFVLNSNPLLVINGKVDYEKLDLRRNEKFINWTLFLNVLNINNETLLTCSYKGREGSVSYDAALSRCINEISKKIKNDFNNRLTEFFDGLIKN